MPIRGFFRQIVLLAVFFAAAAPAFAQQAPQRAITSIAGDLYRFQNNNHFSVFLVTPDGVIATDPINAEAAAWLKTEIATRFGQPIRYVVYSHDHADHISGGEVLADGAVIVAHENAKADIIGEKRPTAVPMVTFRDRMTIELGGKTVNLLYFGPSHSDNLIFMHFPAERTVFAVDAVSVNRLPFRDLGDAYIPEWIDTLRRVETLDFDILAPGHGPLGTAADLAAHRGYLEDLYAAVLGGLRAGLSLDQLKETITLEKYKDWGQYAAWLPLNIEGMARQVALHRR